MPVILNTNGVYCTCGGSLKSVDCFLVCNKCGDVRHGLLDKTYPICYHSMWYKAENVPMNEQELRGLRKRVLWKRGQDHRIRLLNA